MTKFFFNNYKNNNQNIFNNNAISLAYTTSASHGASKLNSLSILENYKLPKINNKRNAKLVNYLVDAIKAFMNTQTNLSDSVKSVLGRFMGLMKLMFAKDVSTFIVISKLYANWFKVNVSKVTRTQDAIPNTLWDRDYQCPRDMKAIFVILDNERNQATIFLIIRVVLTILDIYKVTLAPTMPKLETITNPGNFNNSAIDSINIPLCLKMLGIDVSRVRSDFAIENETTTLHSSSAAGPNGQSLWMSHVDAKAIFSNKELLGYMERFAELVKRSELFSKLEDTVRLPQFFKLTEGVPVSSRLHFIFEKGDKARTIAILDWWTQEFMNPLHNIIAGILKNIQNDGTFDQDKIANIVRTMTAVPGAELHSLDLTAATDRLPIALQAKILDELLAIKGFGEAWTNLAVNRDFTIANQGEIRYAVGQPMGMKSSFPMLGLTHHIIVMQSAIMAGLQSFTDYVILGDDIVIANTAVAREYRNLMERLGLELSDYKSLVSVPSSNTFTIAEICRRVFSVGVELSPLPVKLMGQVIENPDMAYQLQEEMVRRQLVYIPEQMHHFMVSLIPNNVDQARLTILNNLPQEMTGLKSHFNYLLAESLNPKTWFATHGITIDTLLAFYTYTVCVEQLKRLSNVVQNTTSTYATIMKAANVAKVEGIGMNLQQYVPVEDFTEDDLADWDVIEAFHPAHEVVKAEVDRINDVLVQLSILTGKELIGKLLIGLVDSLKISSAEMVIDKGFAEAKVTRMLIDKTMQNIKIAQLRDNKTLSFSTKLENISTVWTLRVQINGTCTISDSISKVTTTLEEAQNRINQLNQNGNVLDIFGTK